MTATQPEVASRVCQPTLQLANFGSVTDIGKAGGELLRRLAVANRKPRSLRCTAFRLACAVFVTEARLDAPTPLAVSRTGFSTIVIVYLPSFQDAVSCDLPKKLAVALEVK